MTDDDLFAFLEEGMGEVDTSDVIDVSTLSTLELFNMFAELNTELFECKEAIRPKSQWARDAHSLRNAIQVELQRRGHEAS